MQKVTLIFLAIAATLTDVKGVSARRRGGSDTAAALAAVRAELHDPSSASFESVKVLRFAICGTVEAKTDLGGYTGRMLFVYVRPEAKAYVLDIASERGVDAGNAAIEAYERYCQR